MSNALKGSSDGRRGASKGMADRLLNPWGHRGSGHCWRHCRQLTRSLNIWFAPCANNDISFSFGIHRWNSWYICTWEGLLWGKVNMPPEGSERNGLGFVCKRQVTRIKQLNQLNSTHVCLETHLVAWFTDCLYQFGAEMVRWESAELYWYKTTLGKRPGSAICVGNRTRVRQWNSDLGEKPSSKYTPSQKLTAEGKPPQIPNTRYLIHVARDPCETVLILTDPHSNSEDKGPLQGQRCYLAGTDHCQACPCTRGAGRAAGHTATDPKGCSASGFCLCLWDTTTLTVPPLQPTPALQASSTQGNILLVDWEKVGAAAAALLLLCFVLRVQLPKTQSHKTQFTIPAAFWHPSVLAYR